MAATRLRASSSPTDWLAKLTTTPKPRPASIVLYGPPGIGKTSFGAASPDPVFLIDQTERGIETLKQAGLVDPVPVFPAAGKWSDTLDILKCLATAEHDHKTLVIDSLGGFERLCHEHVCKRDFNGEWGDRGFASYAKGYEVSLADWRQFLNLLDDIRDAGVRVIALAHSIVRPHKNPAGEDYDQFVPDLHRKTWALTHKWADVVLFAQHYVAIDSNRKGRSSGKRVLHTQFQPAFEAKNRHNMSAQVDMGKTGAEAWANFTADILRARKDTNHASSKS